MGFLIPQSVAKYTHHFGNLLCRCCSDPTVRDDRFLWTENGSREWFTRMVHFSIVVGAAYLSHSNSKWHSKISKPAGPRLKPSLWIKPLRFRQRQVLRQRFSVIFSSRMPGCGGEIFFFFFFWINTNKYLEGKRGA